MLRKLKQLEKPATFILFLALILLNMVALHFIDVLQGDGRVINYAGIVRGAAQKLVKKEIVGEKDNALLGKLTEIIRELRTGQGDNGLVVFEDTAYQAALTDLQRQWDELTDEIEKRRESGETGRLFVLSERFFDAANSVVFLAEKVSDAKLQKVVTFRFILLGVSLILLVMFVCQLIDTIRLQMQNRQLEEKALVD